MPKKGTKKGSSKKEKEEEEFELEKEEEPKETGKKERKKRKRKATSAFKEELTALFERPFIQRFVRRAVLSRMVEFLGSTAMGSMYAALPNLCPVWKEVVESVLQFEPFVRPRKEGLDLDAEDYRIKLERFLAEERRKIKNKLMNAMEEGCTEAYLSLSPERKEELQKALKENGVDWLDATNETAWYEEIKEPVERSLEVKMLNIEVGSSKDDVVYFRLPEDPEVATGFRYRVSLMLAEVIENEGKMLRSGNRRKAKRKKEEEDEKEKSSSDA